MSQVKVPWFVENMKPYDPGFIQAVETLVQEALAPGALDVKTKLLITLALDALKGAEQGVRVLAAQARAAGASDQEIAEALRLACYVAAVDPVKCALAAFAG